VFENGMNFVCEKAVGAEKKCDFRTGAVILQKKIEREQVAKLLANGKTDLIKGFVSKRNGRTFEAFLVLGKDGKAGFEFAPRPARGKGAGKAKEPVAKVDFTGLTPLGKCPKCGGQVFEGPEHYLCEKTQAESRPCKFKVGRVILEQPVDHAQLAKLLAGGQTDLLTGFVSRKTGKNFKAMLKLENKVKVVFEFPEREESGG
jgi:DNA topoisomerase-3